MKIKTIEAKLVDKAIETFEKLYDVQLKKYKTSSKNEIY